MPLSRRARIRLILVLAVLGLPAAVAGVGVWYLGSGRLERRIAAEWALRFPGRLRVDKVEAASADSAHAREVTLTAPGGGAPVVRVPLLALRGGLVPPRLEAIAAEDISVRIDRQTVDLAMDIAAAAGRQGGGGGEARPLSLRLGGEATVAEALRLAPWRLELDLAGDALRGEFTGTLDGEALALELETLPGPAARYKLSVRRCVVPLAALSRALAGFGMQALPADLLAWLPQRCVLDGTVLELDPAGRAMGGAVQLAWDGGSARATLALDARRLVLDGLSATDAGLGGGDGRVELAFAGPVLTVDLQRWKPGPRVRLPEAIPVDELLTLLPRARVEARGQGDGLRAQLSMLAAAAPRPFVTLTWSPQEPARLEAEALPLSLLKRQLPERVRIDAGAIERFDAQWRERLEMLALRVRDADLEIAGWRLEDADLNLGTLPEADGGGWSTIATLAVEPEQGAATVLAWLRHRGRPERGRVELGIDDAAEVARRLRGPAPLPTIAGGLRVDADYRISDGGVTGDIAALTLSGVQLEKRVLRGMGTTARGRYAVSGGRVRVDLDGQLASGEVWVPEAWLDLARQRPLYTASATITSQRIEQFNAMARAGDERGQPLAKGFTADLAGSLAFAPFTGSANGVIDRADLGWFKANTPLRLFPLPDDTRLSGEGALTWESTFDRDGVGRIEGCFLPLNVDLNLLGGKLDFTGISGILRIAIRPRPPAPAPTPDAQPR